MSGADINELDVTEDRRLMNAQNGAERNESRATQQIFENQLAHKKETKLSENGENDLNL